MSRLVLTLALSVTMAACAPSSESRVTIGGGGPRVIFEDELKAPINWPAAHGTICRSSYSDGGYVVENIGRSACLLAPARATTSSGPASTTAASHRASPSWPRS